MSFSSFLNHFNPYKKKKTDSALQSPGVITDNWGGSSDDEPATGKQNMEPNPAGQATDYIMSGMQEPQRVSSSTPTSYTPQPTKPASDDAYQGVREKLASDAITGGDLPGRYKVSEDMLSKRPQMQVDAKGNAVDTNGRLKSGLAKGGDAFLRSGNPFAFLFGGLSGATNDRTYDERKDYNKKEANWERQYGTQFEHEKAAAAAAQKDRDYRLEATKTAGGLLTASQEEANRVSTAKRSDEAAGRAMMAQVTGKQGGTWLPGQKEAVERQLGVKMPDKLTPDISNRIEQMLDSNGKRVWGTVNTNEAQPQFKSVLGPNGETARAPEPSPLVTINDTTGDAKAEGDATIRPKSPQQIETEATDAAIKEIQASYPGVDARAMLGTQIGNKILDKHRKIISETDAQDVEGKRAGIVNSARKKFRAGQATTPNKGANNSVGTKSSVQDRIKGAFNQ